MILSRPRPRLRLALALAALACSGCQEETTTPFPPGLEPFEDDDLPAMIVMTPIEELRTEYAGISVKRVYGRGFFFAPLSVLYEAARDPQNMIAICSTTTQTVMLGNESQYDISYLVRYFADEIFDVEWDDQWRGDVLEGTPAAPRLARFRHQKVQGSSFIGVSEGTVTLLATSDPQVTEIQFIEKLEAVSASWDNVRDGMQSNYDRLLAVTRGQPAPPCP